MKWQKGITEFMETEKEKIEKELDELAAIENDVEKLNTRLVNCLDRLYGYPTDTRTDIQRLLRRSYLYRMSLHGVCMKEAERLENVTE